MYREMFENYIPKNEQEARDKAAILSFIQTHEDALDRTNLIAHVTSSAFVVNKAMDKVLFAYHNIYDSWAWVGGHNDGNPNLLEVAIKEAKEETGLTHVTPYAKDIFTIDVIYVKNHIKQGTYIPDHLHLNATFLLIANEEDSIEINHHENKGVRWFGLDEVMEVISEERMRPVYQKAFAEIINIRDKTRV